MAAPPPSSSQNSSAKAMVFAVTDGELQVAADGRALRPRAGSTIVALAADPEGEGAPLALASSGGGGRAAAAGVERGGSVGPAALSPPPHAPHAGGALRPHLTIRGAGGPASS